MNYICDKYGFEASINQNYELIKGDKFKQLMTKGTRKLKSIKYKYFTDKFIEMWKLLYTFFDKAESAQRGKSRREEMLLVRNFNIVFEDMIDDLIGDKIEDLPKNLKDQNDGKIVDHIFKYQSLVIEDDIYFVGDSKYYKSNAQIEKKSIEKQYTYARNIIQHSINLFNNHKLPGNFRYRDNDTEGYNITPNFFISAFIEKPYDTTTDGLDTDGRDPKKYTYTQSHFNNRLFDRDTLTVQRYNINFLYVLSAYTSKGSMTKVLFKNKAQSKFRDELIKYFISTYTFHQVTPIDGIDIKDFINKYFRLLIGKMYKPSQITGSIILAFNKEDNMNSVYSEAFKQECANLGLNDFEADCKIDDYKLGE